MKTTRVQLEFPERSFNRLRTLKEKTEAVSYAEVMKNALRIYETLIQEYEAGNVFLVKNPEGKLTEYRIFV